MTPHDVGMALDRTFGSLPELEVPPRGEWDRGEDAKHRAGIAGSRVRQPNGEPTQ